VLSRELQNRSGAGHIVARQHRAALEKVRGELHYGEVMLVRHLPGDRPHALE
jgi:hypothetical protein